MINQFGNSVHGSTITGPRHGRIWRRRIAAAIGFSMLPGLLTPISSAAAAPEPLGEPQLKKSRSADVTPFTAEVNKKNSRIVAKGVRAGHAAARRARTDQARKVTWPDAEAVTLTLRKSSRKAVGGPDALPLTLQAPEEVNGKKPKTAERVTAKILGRKMAEQLGVKGVVLTVTGPPSGGQAQLTMNYAAFASAYGGNWAGRLHIVELPNCALTDPGKTQCRKRQPHPSSSNNRADEQLTSKLAFAADNADSGNHSGEVKVLALTAGTKSGAGDYKATPLSASSTWEAGGSSGSFTWSYPLRMPPSAAGPRPDLSISYNSSAVDGRTASTNNQGTVIGEGFDLTSSFIERKFGACDDDGHTDKFDLCWKYDNASLVLNGKATELVKDDTTGQWRLQNDDASTVTHSTGADNGDDNGEHWTVTTGDGTRYVFGLNKLPGAGTDDRTESVWTVPVFGDDSGEPGYSSGDSFSGRSKKQAWRWNLDYVEDTRNNAMSYWYEAEENNYDKLGDDTIGTGYVRGGYLKEIRYGQRADALFSATPAASNKVTFTYAERCLAAGDGCDSLTEDTRDNWPDVPFDSLCKDGDKCTGNSGATFFTRKRLTGITTHAWDTAADPAAYVAIDAWTLKQLYLDPGDTGDSSDQSLWLQQIQHTGKRGTDISLDPVTFTHVFLPNRVDGASDDILSLDKPRLKTITSETGAQTIVSYAEGDCTAGQAKPAVDENTFNCYPVYWSPNGEETPILDWFQKYPVTAVSTTDPHGGSEAVQHTYKYSGGGAWHYNNDPMTPAEERTWSIWRGFGKVTHLTGDAGSDQLKTVTIYMRGMNGDRVLGPDGKTPDPDARKSVEVTGIKADAITDSDQYAGYQRETVTYDGDNEVTGTINDPWSKRTATQHKSYADIESYFVRTAATHERTRVTSGSTPKDRVRTTKTTYDSYGMAATVQDNGDNAVTGDEKCTRNWYARNDQLGINKVISRTRTVAQPCSTSDADLDLPTDASRPGDVITDTAKVFDDTNLNAWSAAQEPTKGDVVWSGRAKSYDSDGTPAWQTVTTTSYDALGRAVAIKDTNGLTTATTTYTPAAGGPQTATAVENAEGHKTTSSFDLGTGAPLKITDPNGKITQTEYDSLGRLTKVWLPNRLKIRQSPNHTYEYNVSNSHMSWVATRTLKGDGSGYNTTYAFYDSLLRPRQVQAPTPVGGRLISLTLYDDRGLAISAQSDIWDDTSAPNSTPVQTEGGQAPVQTDTTYDGAGRPTKTVTKNFNVTRWTTETSYTGDTVTSTAPGGGQATTVVTNALGQTVERREYGNPQPVGDYSTTTSTYTPAGQQKTVTGPDQAKWSYTYDLFGRQTSATDPDKGTGTTAYNALDQIISATDAEGRTLLTEYDDLGRVTGTWHTAKTDDNKLTAFTFDGLAKGQPDTSIRYDGGAKGKAYTQKVTRYTPLYQVMRSQLTLPASDPLVAAGVPQTLYFSTGFRLDGTISQSGEPAVAGLSAETIAYDYNATGQQIGASGTTGYLHGAVYSPQGDLRQLTLGKDGSDSAQKAYLAYEYEAGTRRLTRSWVTDDVHPYMPQELKYTQDDAGNITSIFDATTQNGATRPDYQCFQYDGHRRLTEAWTPRTADCSIDGRTTANIDGQAPYWTSYTYTEAGQRKTETQHTGAGNTTTSYTYGTTTGQPHTLTSTTSDSSARKYTYDAAGNTLTRPGPTAEQTLTWNTEGDLATVKEDTAETSYLYGPSGDLLIRRAKGDGDTVLYLGATEIRLTTQGSSTTLSGSRYYTAAGQTIAVRTATGGNAETKLEFLAADHHGTSSLAIKADTYRVTKRYTTPYGDPRGPEATEWPDDKAFLGKTADDVTGLTHIGARQYDPGIGQFISVDPLLEVDKHQSLNGYSYGHNNPVTFSDPSGLGVPGCHTGLYMGCNNGVPDDDTTYHPERARTVDLPDWQIEGRATGLDLNGDGRVSLLPGTSIPDSWHKTRSFIKAFYGRLHYLSSGYGVESYIGRSDASALTDVAASLRDACHKTGCPSFREYFYNFFGVNALAGISEGAAGGRAGRRGTSPCNKCFLAGTEVLLADESTKNIEDVEVGDVVIASDPETGETGPRRVTALIVTESDKRFNKLSIATSQGIEPLTATYEHPFWSPSEDDWIPASALRSGMTLLTDDGDTVVVTANHPFTQRARTYNLTVDDLHTYYVLAGETPVLVHNSNCGPGTKFDVPTEPGIYTIHLGDGTKYVGSSTSSIRERVNKSMRSKHAVRKAGYTSDDVVNVTYFTLPAGTSKTAIRRMEQTMMEGVKARGGTLLNRRDPEIEVPIGGYLP